MKNVQIGIVLPLGLVGLGQTIHKKKNTDAFAADVAGSIDGTGHHQLPAGISQICSQAIPFLGFKTETQTTAQIYRPCGFRGGIRGGGGRLGKDIFHRGGLGGFLGSLFRRTGSQ